MKTTLLFSKRRKYCEMYERGIIPFGEFQMRLVELMLEAGDDSLCLELCSDLPESVRGEFLNWIVELGGMDFYSRSFTIGDWKPSDQIHAEAVERQELLRRLAPRLRSVLQFGQSAPM